MPNKPAAFDTSTGTLKPGTSSDPIGNTTQHFEHDWGAIAAPGTAIHAQVAAGAPLNVTTAFTLPFPRRTCEIILGAGGANPVVYTITGTAVDGSTITDMISAAGPGTYQGAKAFETITSLTSNIDPAGTTDLKTGNGVACAQPFDALDVFAINDVAVAAASSDGASGTIVPNPSTPPDGTRRFSARVSRAHTHNLA